MYPIVDTNRVRKYGDHFPYPINKCSVSVAAVSRGHSTNDNVRTGKYMITDGKHFYFLYSTSHYDIDSFGFWIKTRLMEASISGSVETVDTVVDLGVSFEDWERRTGGGVAKCGTMLCYGLFDRVRCSVNKNTEWKEMHVCGKYAALLVQTNFTQKKWIGWAKIP